VFKILLFRERNDTFNIECFEKFYKSTEVAVLANHIKIKC